MLEEVDTELVKRAQKGDTAVISALYERYHPTVFRYLYYRVGDKHAAEDLTSEVFIRMMRALPGFQLRSASFQAWLFQIARNLAIDHYRKTSTRDLVQLEDNLVVSGEDVEPSIERKLNSQRLQQALTRLTDDQSDVIVLRFVANMPIAQVAQTLHKSEDSIKGLQRRGLIALREILSDWEVTYA